MIKGIGVDMVEIARVRRLIERDRGFAARIFTEREIAYCEAKYSRAQHYAARFTAKEAFFKAMGTGFRGGVGWRDVEVENDELGKPQLRLAAEALAQFHRRGLKRALLSLSHTREAAVALVVVE
jgi:holo-[acyl-carrier protein] synthase